MQSRRSVTNWNCSVQLSAVGPRKLCYVPAAVEGSGRIAWRGLLPCAALSALVVAGCGGGQSQDASEPSGEFRVAVTDARFPASQRLAEPQRLVIAVKNTGNETVPDVAVTVDSFAATSDQAGLASAQRPVWVVDDGPRGGTTAYVNTWALGPLPPGRTRRFVWHVTAVQAGTHTVKWQVAAGLNGKAKATFAGNRAPAGSFTVDVSDKPAESHVDPQTGAVVRGGG
jgi:hypothetical protein